MYIAINDIYIALTSQVAMQLSNGANNALNQIGFYPRDAMLARVIAIATCLSVRLSVRHAPVLCQNEES